MFVGTVLVDYSIVVVVVVVVGGGGGCRVSWSQRGLTGANGQGQGQRLPPWEVVVVVVVVVDIVVVRFVQRTVRSCCV